MMNDNSVRILKKIYKADENIFVSVELRNKTSSTNFKHVNLLSENDECKIIPVSLISKKLIFIEENNFDYYCAPPNKIEIE